MYIKKKNRITTTGCFLNRKILLGVLQLVVFREAAGLYQLVVDAAGLDGVYQFQYRQTAADLLVLITT